MGHIFLSFLFFNFIYIIFYQHYKRGDYYINKTNLVIYTLLLVAFGTYGGGEGDYVHYKERIEEFHSILDVLYAGGMEKQYYYLAYLVDGNYDLWRLVLFSIQFVGMSWLLYKAKLNTYPILLCFIASSLVSSVYGRAYWGSIFYFLGTYLLIEKKNPLFLIIIALSYFSHTQNIVLLAMLPLAFINIKKWHILLVIVLSGTLVTLLKDTFTNILNSGGIEGADYVNDRMQKYSEGSLGNFGNSIGEYIMFVLHYVPIALVLLTYLKVLFKQRNKYLSFYKPYRGILNVAIGIVATSIIVLLAALGGGTFFYRILAMAGYPITLLLPYMVESNVIKKKTFNLYILFFFITTEISYFKDLYYAYMNGNF